MPSPFEDRTIGYIRFLGLGIENVATNLGTPPTAIAGAIANEFDARLTGGFFTALGAPVQKGADILAIIMSDARLRENFAELQTMTDAQIKAGGIVFKALNPVVIDVGPGNISIRTAIKLLNEYAAQNPSDPLNILHYRNDYSRLVRDLTDWGGDTTAKFAGLMIAKGEQFFETHAANWNTLSIDQKDALLVSYYKLGQEHFQQDYLAAANTGSPYNPIVGDIGQTHVVNANALLLALGGVTQIPVFRPEGVETVAVSPDAARQVLGHQFDGTLADAARIAAAITDGRITAVGDFVDDMGMDRYTAPFDGNPNKIVIAGDENGTTVATVSNNFLQHITALPANGMRIDTAFAPDGGRLVTTNDLPDFHGWDREIAASIPTASSTRSWSTTTTR